MSQRQQLCLICRITLLTIGLSLACSGNAVWGQATRTWDNTNTGWGGPPGSPLPWFDVDGNWSAGVAPGPLDTARFFHDPFSPFEVWWDDFTQSQVPQVGKLLIESGNVLFRNVDNGPQYKLTLTDTSPLALHISEIGSFGFITGLALDGIHLESLGGAFIETGSGLNVGGIAGFSPLHPLGSKLSVGGELYAQGQVFVNGNSAMQTLGGSVIDNGGSGNGSVFILNSAQWNASGQIVVGQDWSGSLFCKW